MRIYLAARYSRYPEMQLVRNQLALLGHSVTSRWIDGDHQISNDGLSSEAKAVGKRCVVVGFRENVFHCLPEVKFFEAWSECFVKLAEAVQVTG